MTAAVNPAPGMTGRAVVRVRLLALAMAVAAGIACGILPYRPLVAPPGAMVGDVALLPGYVQAGVWWLILATGVLALAVAAMPQIVCKPLPPVGPPAPLCRKAAWILPVLAVGASAGTAVLAWPRMNHSLWNDEAYAARHYLHGAWEYDAARGGLVFRATPWPETLWLMRAANNHLLFSALSRVANDSQRRLAGAPPTHFSEPAMRLPAFVGGLFAAALIVFAAAKCVPESAGAAGTMTAAIVAGVVFVAHPWSAQFASESRGYSLGAALFLGALLSLRHAWRAGGRFGAWLLFAVLQAASLLAQPGSVPFWLVFNTLLVGAIAVATRPRLLVAGRVVAAVMLAALLVFAWAAPCIPQVRLFLSLEQPISPLNAAWGLETLAHLWGGVPWSGVDPGTAMRPPFVEQWRWNSVGLTIGMAGLAIFLLAGAWTLVQRGGPVGFAMAISIPATIAAYYLRGILADDFIYPWYIFPVLPPLAICAGVGAAALVEAGRQNCMRRVRSLTTAVVVAVPMLVLCLHWPVLAALRTHPRHPLRETAAVARRLAGSPGQSLVIGTGQGVLQLALYAPEIVYAANGADLDRMLNWARENAMNAIVILGARPYVALSDRRIVETLNRYNSLISAGVHAGWDAFHTLEIAVLPAATLRPDAE